MKCNTCGKMNCMAHGGGVNRQHPDRQEGTSEAGHYAKYQPSDGDKSWTNSKAKEMHGKTLAESRSMPGPKLKGLAHGGMAGKDGTDMYEMDPDVPSMHGMDDGGEVDSELDNMLADECFEALEKKDKQGFLDALKAIIASSGGDL